jgi:PIN domain nuclease of toxin-antitoxin system
MRLLLDTHTFLWAITDDPALSGLVRNEILNDSNEVYVSSASLWEIAIKFGLGRISLPDDPDRYLPPKRVASGFELLTIGEAESCQIHRLPPIHRDPFDRMLVSQASCQGMVIATDDPMIRRYPVSSIW